MKLRNKKTGKIIDIYKGMLTLHYNQGRKTIHFKRLEDLEEWEDYEEPKEYFYIYADGNIYKDIQDDVREDNGCKEIGNYFETKEEAEKAVEKLKAWKRLNKCEFRFEGYNNRDRANGGDIVIYAHVDIPNNNLLEEAQPTMLNDLDLLFGGEE